MKSKTKRELGKNANWKYSPAESIAHSFNVTRKHILTGRAEFSPPTADQPPHPGEVKGASELGAKPIRGLIRNNKYIYDALRGERKKRKRGKKERNKKYTTSGKGSVAAVVVHSSRRRLEGGKKNNGHFGFGK